MCRAWQGTAEQRANIGVTAALPSVTSVTLPGGALCTILEGLEVSCQDGIDNDCNGFTDGNDPNCPFAPIACAPTLPSSAALYWV